MNNQVPDVLILGGGPSGLTAAIYTARAGLSTTVISGNPSGGQLTQTTDVENFPGFPEGVKGPQLILNMRSQAERFGSTFIDENVTNLSGSFEKGFTATTDLSHKVSGRSVIIATGASAKWLGLESEQRLKGKGVSACATCDGFFFKNKVVAIVGGGDAAMEESIHLTNFASKIYLIIRGNKEQIRASQIMQERVLKQEKIIPLFNTEVLEVLGTDFVTGIKIKNNSTGEEKVMDDVRGLFVAVGHKPNTDFLANPSTVQIELGKFGYAVPKSGSFTHSMQEGVFIAGDVADYRYRQAITAAGFGCMAAIDCQRFLSERS